MTYSCMSHNMCVLAVVNYSETLAISVDMHGIHKHNYTKCRNAIMHQYGVISQCAHMHNYTYTHNACTHTHTHTRSKAKAIILYGRMLSGTPTQVGNGTCFILLISRASLLLTLISLETAPRGNFLSKHTLYNYVTVTRQNQHSLAENGPVIW